MQTLNSANYGATLAEAAEHLRNLEPFHTGTLSGLVEPLDGMQFYVVRSYGTPIAMTLMNSGALDPEPEVFPSAYTHSATTSKHANLVKRAWGL